jgi:hypothetical protein
MVDVDRRSVLRERASPSRISANVAAVAATDDYTVTSSAGFLVGSLVFGSASRTPRTTACTSNERHYGRNARFDERTRLSTKRRNANAKTLEVVGYQFPADDVRLRCRRRVRLTSATIDMTTLGLIPGEFVFLGGDAAGNAVRDVDPGYARVAAITATHIDFDKTTFTAGADAGAGKSIRMFFGTVVRNEADPDLIVRHELYVERLLGNDDDGVQSEVIERASSTN